MHRCSFGCRERPVYSPGNAQPEQKADRAATHVATTTVQRCHGRRWQWSIICTAVLQPDTQRASSSAAPLLLASARGDAASSRPTALRMRTLPLPH
ncbi:hypothetical protein XAR_4577 [Xanthomonas citri pv. glycines str. 8ra]|nr:hypothetical protein XAR_4577 [Xanthomonas citri pv. glycines str. 8ra]